MLEEHLMLLSNVKKLICRCHGSNLCHFTSMICLSLFIRATQSDVFWKTICACPSSICSNDDTKCTALGQPILNTDSSTFIEDFQTLRNNIKNVELYFNTNQRFDLNLDIRDLAGLTINFSCKSSAYLSFTYVNNGQYGGSNFKFDKKISAKFIPIVDSEKTNVLKIGSILATDIPVTFYKNGDKKTILQISEFELDVGSFDNISSIEKKLPGLNYIKLGSKDTVDIKFTKTGVTFNLNENNIGFTGKAGDWYSFEGAYRGTMYSDTLDLTFDADVSIENLPIVDIQSISIVKISGKLWKPTESRPIKEIIRVGSIDIPAGDFPFSVFSDKFEITFNGDTIVYGDIDATKAALGTAEMSVNTGSTSKINISFKGYVDSKITIKSPYMNLNIYNFSCNYAPFDFPIGGCFNEKSASYVYVKSATFEGESVTTKYIINLYPTITDIFTDKELDASILKGFVFIDLPPGTFIDSDFAVSINPSSPSGSLGIPGFSKSKCVKVTLNNNDRAQLECQKYKTAYDTPMYICLTSSQWSYCPNPPGTEGNPYINVYTLENGDISKYITKGYQIIYICSLIDTIYIDFNTLQQDNYNVTLVSDAYGSRGISFSANKGKINTLIASYINFYESTSFDVDMIEIKRSTFSSSKRYSFGSTTLVTIDDPSLDSLSKASRVSISDLTIYYDISRYYDEIKSYSYYGETIDINNNQMTLCARGFDDIKDDPDLMCSDTIDPSYFSKITLLSKYGLELITDSDPSSMNMNVKIRPNQLNYDYSLTLLGTGWNAEFKKPIPVDQGKTSINLLVSSPGQGKNLEFTGDGKVLYKANYPKGQKYCLYSYEADYSCNTHDSSVIKNGIDNYKSMFDSLTPDKISCDFQIDQVTETTVKVPLSVFDKRRVSLSTSAKTPDNYAKTSVEIDIQDSEIDPLYSMTIFNKIKLLYTGGKEVTCNMGQLILNEVYFDENWKKYVNLNVSQLDCNYADLYQFKSIKINDQLRLTGDMPDNEENLVIDFKPDEDANDLITNIKGNVTITVGNGFIKIGNITFKISHSKNYDAYLTVTENSDITIVSETSNSNEFMKFEVDCQNYDVNLTFINVFPDVAATDESMMMFKGTGKINVITSSSLPLSLSGFYDIEFHMLSSSIAIIQGPIEYTNYYDYNYDSTFGRIRFYNHQNDRIVLNVPQGFTIGNIERNANFIGFMSPRIELTISRIAKTGFAVSTLAFIHAIDNTGSSKVTINERLPDSIDLNNKFTIYSEVKGIIVDENNFPFVSKPETVIRAKPEDFTSQDFQFSYKVLNRTGLTHGFYPGSNCLGIQTKRGDGLLEVQLYAAIKPSQIPFTIDLIENGKSSDSELVIDDDNMKTLLDLTQLLPKAFIGIIMRIHRDMNYDSYLDLSKIVTGRDYLSFSISSVGRSRYQAYISLPSSEILNLSFNNIGLEFIGSSKEFIAKVIDFNDCDFSNAKDFKISNKVTEIKMDVDSLNGLIAGGSLSSYTQKVIVNAANVVVFSTDGWEFREKRDRPTSLIQASKYKNLEFRTSSFCYLMIEDETLTSIKSFNFNSYPNSEKVGLFELSRHWGKIKDLDNFKINVNGAEKILLNTASYPIPKIFDIPDNNISYTFETDDAEEFDTLRMKTTPIRFSQKA